MVKRYFVIHTAGPYLCNADGIRVMNFDEPKALLIFDTLKDAEAHCQKIINRLPFIRCHVKNFVEEKELLLSRQNFDNFIHLSNPNFKGVEMECKQATGKYAVRLYHSQTDGVLNIDGTYSTKDWEKPVATFNTKQEAIKYCKLVMRKFNYMDGWIYGREGKVVWRSGIDVVLHESGEYTIPIKKWWKFWRKF